MTSPAWDPAPGTELSEFSTALIGALAGYSPAALDALEAEMQAARWTLNISLRPAAAFCAWLDVDGPRRVDFRHPNQPPLDPGQAPSIVRVTAIPFRSFAVAARVLAEGNAARAANSVSNALPGASENEKPLSSARTKAAKSSVNSVLREQKAYKPNERSNPCKPSENREYPIFHGRRKRKNAGNPVAYPSTKGSDDDYASATATPGRRPRS